MKKCLFLFLGLVDLSVNAFWTLGIPTKLFCQREGKEHFLASFIKLSLLIIRMGEVTHSGGEVETSFIGAGTVENEEGGQGLDIDQSG